MNKIVCLAALTMLTSTIRSFAQEAEIPLWPNGAPGALGTAPKDIPSLTPFISSKASDKNGTIIILPGGGYQHLAAHEGHDYAVFLNQRGITTFVLKYRLASDGYHHPSMEQDVARAVRYVRANAEKYKIDSDKIGVMGSSAGGHLASTLLTHYDAGDANAADPIDKISSKPDFGILCYAVITMGENTHAGSRRGLLGDNPSPELVKEFSNELQVTDKTPPCFIWHTRDDRTVPVENSINFADALKKNNVPFELHIYEHGNHGLGLGDRNPPYAHPLPWTGDLMVWLKARGLTTQEP
ncbi:MAG TPA: alpha/beta hydrolase [Tepidisphaeraceae bacterium]|nr:alpha/beta hydrolase [Tepidisphaeraceae bacterium]